MSGVAVVINPERFAQKFVAKNFSSADYPRPRSTWPRRHTYKTARICEGCLYGKHSTCGSADCSCIHRENEPFAGKG